MKSIGREVARRPTIFCHFFFCQRRNIWHAINDDFEQTCLVWVTQRRKLFRLSDAKKNCKICQRVWNAKPCAIVAVPNYYYCKKVSSLEDEWHRQLFRYFKPTYLDCGETFAWDFGTLGGCWKTLNTHRRGEFHCTAGLKFDWFAFYQTKKYAVLCTT